MKNSTHPGLLRRVKDEVSANNGSGFARYMRAFIGEMNPESKDAKLFIVEGLARRDKDRLSPTF